jgi:hypothetical protein
MIHRAQVLCCQKSGGNGGANIQSQLIHLHTTLAPPTFEPIPPQEPSHSVATVDENTNTAMQEVVTKSSSSPTVNGEYGDDGIVREGAVGVENHQDKQFDLGGSDLATQIDGFWM